MTDNTINFSAAKVLVVGDVMLDQYWHGGTTRISPEAPVPVVKVNSTDNRLGGAANVANNLITLGCQVKLLGIAGRDPAAGILQKLLDSKHINNELLQLEKFSTIVKLRVLCRNQQMIRLDHEEELEPIDIEKLKILYDLYSREISNYQAIILSDYSKGVLTNPQPYIKSANALGVPVIVDPKSKDFAVYKNAYIVKPNLNEFESIVGKCTSLAMLEEKAHNLLATHEISNLVITRGSHGITLINKNKPAVHMPAYGGEVYDVTGAGDTVIAVISAGMAAGLELEKSVYLSTLAAGIVVGKVGTSSVSAKELQQAVGKHNNSYNNKELPLGIADEVTLREVIKLCQEQGQKVVFVNGCYDLIHFGHIRYLEKARAMGDKLIVGVNTDESVKRLKGDSRPMYSLSQRMETLAGLKAVDWVVPFAEDTPGRLVEALSPDILVKGGENFKSIEQIPATEGVNHVLKNGGQVFLVDRTEGVSSSQMIEFIAENN